MAKKKAQPKRTKASTSFWISPEAKQLLAALSEALGITQSGVFEQAIRLLARREGIKAEKAD
jgi:hypothetical protein